MGDIFGDIFGDFFGGGRRGGDARRNGPRQGANLRAGVRITFDDAIRGVDKELAITLKEECKTCNGSGAKPGTSPETCPKCKGTGQVVFTQQSICLLYTSFLIKEEAEITMEANPGTLTKKNLSAYKDAGINRLSMGLQSADNSLSLIHIFKRTKLRSNRDCIRKRDF